MSEAGRRALRVAGLVRARFVEATRRELADPKLSGLVVSDVRITDDLSLVHVSVRFLGVESVDERRLLLRKLIRVLPRLRRSMLDKLELRRVPELRLHLDEGGDAAQRVEELLKEIEEERKNKE